MVLASTHAYIAQVPPVQVKGTLHVFPVQHGWPPIPQGWQVPHPQEENVHEQMLYGAQVWSEQQAPPISPQQVPLSQVPPFEQAAPDVQQGCPDPPHAVQVPDVH